MFANPGSTEVPFLAALPDDIRFVLGLHETAVVGLASGLAIGTRRPALVLLHTTAGLGTAVSALATARVNRAPLVVVVGQQDRRHLAYEPFLAGKLSGLAGEYPVSVDQPALAQDVPAAIERAFHAAEAKRGPALVIVPMDDWEQPADEEREPAAAVGPVWRAAAAAPEAVDALVAFLAEAKSPALVVGAGADDEETWAALVELAERLVAPVFQESFGGRAGFPQDHRLFCGVLPAERGRLRERLDAYDTVFVVGAPAFRQAPYVPGRFTAPGTRIAVVGDDAHEVHRSPAEVAVVASPAVRVPGARRPRSKARRRAAGAVASAASARTASRRRASLCKPRARGAGRAAAAERRRRRGSAGRSPRHSRAPARTRASRLPQRSPRRPGLRHACGCRSAHGPAEPTCRCRRRRRLGNLRRSRRLERGALRDRRPLRRPLERALRSHGQARRAPWRHRLPGLRSPRSSWRRLRVASAVHAERITTHDEMLSALDEVGADARGSRRASRAGRPRGAHARLCALAP